MMNTREDGVISSEVNENILAAVEQEIVAVMIAEADVMTGLTEGETHGVAETVDHQDGNIVGNIPALGIATPQDGMTCLHQ